VDFLPSWIFSARAGALPFVSPSVPGTIGQSL
jgi:hypothetical protein